MDEIRDKRKMPFTSIENRVLEDPDIPPNAKLVYVALCRFASWETGMCYPGHTRLGKMLGLHRNTIIKSTQRLKELGLITIEKRTGDTHVYTLLDTCTNTVQGDAQKEGRGCTNIVHKQEPYKQEVINKKSEHKKHFAEFVTLTLAEYEKLLADYGQEDTDRLIEILDNYKGASGKRYKSDYRAILNWVVERLKHEKKKPDKTGAWDEMAAFAREMDRRDKQ